MRAFLFCVFYIVWLILCFALAMVGALIPFRKKNLDPSHVKKSLTICRCLFEKNKIDESVYAFETDQVAISYNNLVFRGYSLIVSPLIYVLKRFDFMDMITLYFVDRWVSVHRFYLVKDKTITPPKIHIAITKFCVFMAQSVGKILTFFGVS